MHINKYLTQNTVQRDIRIQSSVKYLLHQNISLFDDLKVTANGAIAHSASFAISIN